MKKKRDILLKGLPCKYRGCEVIVTVVYLMTVLSPLGGKAWSTTTGQIKKEKERKNPIINKRPALER